MLYTSLPQEVSDFINNTNYRFNDVVDDNFIWPHNKNGVYYTKTGYKWLLSLNETNTETQSWSWICRLKIPDKYKFFIWLMCHNSIPTLSLLHHRNITATEICLRCGDLDETILHCIRDCRHLRNIWQHFGFY